MCSSYPVSPTQNTRRLVIPLRVTDTGDIVEPSALSDAASERLARRWFDLVRQGSFEKLGELLHDDAVLVSRVKAGEVVEGREAVRCFLEEIVSRNLYEAVTHNFTPLDDERVIVEGRMRWIDDERVIRDDPVLWALEFRDGLLLRFMPARTAIEAEMLLATTGQRVATRAEPEVGTP
jgi:SnoaL-like protein